MITPTSPLQIPEPALLEQYGKQARLCATPNDQISLIFSQIHPFDLVELEQQQVLQEVQ